MLEITIFIFGAYILLRGSVPSFIIGGPGFTIDKRGSRIIGLILLLPLPVYLLSGRLFTSLLGDQARGISIVFDVIVFIAALTFALLFARNPRIPISEEESNDGLDDELIEERIAHKTNGSLMYALFGVIGPVALVTGPLVFVRTRQAMDLIEEYQVGEKYRTRAIVARIIAALFFVIWRILFGIIFITAYQGVNL